MATSHKTPFEVIRSESNKGARLEVPEWWQSSKGGGRGDRGGSSDPERRRGLAAWLAEPIRLRVARGLAILIVLLVLAILVGAYQLGRQRAGAGAEAGLARSKERLNELRNQPVDSLLLRSVAATEGGAGPAEGDPASAAGVAANPGGSRPANRTASRQARVPGLNYFCLVTVPEANRAELEKARQFLKQNRVDAIIQPVDNSQLQLIALPGFARPYSPEAEEFKSLLRVLGRAYKAKDGGTDWSDLYAIKYSP